VPTPPRRKETVRLDRLRRPVTLRTLQMMVMSGVVRRADLNPPQPSGRMLSQPTDDFRQPFPQDSASEQGWLSRLFLGRRHPITTANRS
jgi:hypothetical protein